MDVMFSLPHVLIRIAGNDFDFHGDQTVTGVNTRVVHAES